MAESTRLSVGWTSALEMSICDWHYLRPAPHNGVLKPVKKQQDIDPPLIPCIYRNPDRDLTGEEVGDGVGCGQINQVKNGKFELNNGFLVKYANLFVNLVIRLRRISPHS